MSEEGIIFGSTANAIPSIYMPIANRYYERVRGWTPELTLALDRRHATASTRSPTRCGRSITTAATRRLPGTRCTRPARTRGSIGTALRSSASRPATWSGTFVLRTDGADFRSTNPANLLASDDEWVAPIMAEVGPDGNVWVIDWYNYIVQHNPTPRGFETGKGNAYETELRDKQHGRIYRVVYDEAPRAKTLDLSGATPAELVATLANDNLFWRRHAQRLLVELGQQDVVPQLVEMASDKSVDAIGLNVGAIHALWTLQGLAH